MDNKNGLSRLFSSDTDKTAFVFCSHGPMAIMFLLGDQVIYTRKERTGYRHILVFLCWPVFHLTSAQGEGIAMVENFMARLNICRLIICAQGLLSFASVCKRSLVKQSCIKSQQAFSALKIFAQMVF